MTQYINKSALVAEIEERLTEVEKLSRSKEVQDEYSKGYCNGKKGAYRKILSVIDTIEVKEVDLEKEWKEFLKDGDVGFKEIAKHFFELGMQVSNKAQKGEL